MGLETPVEEEGRGAEKAEDLWVKGELLVREVVVCPLRTGLGSKPQISGQK